MEIDNNPRQDNFLAYIASQYQRKKEDVGTDVIAYLLTKAPVQRAFRTLLEDLNWPHLPSAFDVRSRTKGVGGIPDLLVIDQKTRSCKVVIENKFWATLTPHQPCSYLDHVSAAGGLVLFIVPRRRQRYIWEKILARCECASRPVSVANSKLFGRTKNEYVAVTSWEVLLDHLEANINGDRELTVFVEQLRSLCDMAKEDAIPPLNPAVLADGQVGKAVYDYIRLAMLLENAVREEGLIEFPQKQKKGALGESWSGKYGTIGRFTTWIGFDARLWSEHGKSPIWIQFEGKSDIDGHLQRAFEKLKKPFMYFDDSRALVVPIILKPKVNHDVLIEDALSQVRSVASALRNL